MYLPIAHTCFFSIDLPAYTSREVMKEKLMYAITHCQSIDADNTINIYDSVILMLQAS
jgi:E3 ubiquitin-protein ligase HERC2